MLGPNAKILIVDNMVTMRKLIAKICNEIGVNETLEATDVANAWEIIAANVGDIQLVICEWQMPKGTGMDLLKRVRSDARFNEVGFIMLSTVVDPAQVQSVMKAGNSNFMLKPFSAKTLAEKIVAIQKANK